MHFAEGAWEDDGIQSGAIDEEALATFATEDCAVGLVLRDTLLQWLTAKPERVQKVFYLVYEAGLTIAETAKALKQSESNVKNMLYRTIKELRRLLAEEGDRP